MKARKSVSWVVYRTPFNGNTTGLNAVCEQAEWEAMEAIRPGFRTLVKAGIRTEGEAERLARGTSGDPVARGAQTFNRTIRRPSQTGDVTAVVPVGGA
jgi:hypothetical protein